MRGARPQGRPAPAHLACALAVLLLAGACATRPGTAAGQTAVARDTAGPTLVVLPHTPVGNAATQTAAATLHTPLPAAPSATVTVPTTMAPSDVELTLQPCGDQACAAQASHLLFERPIPQGFVTFVERSYPYGSTQSGQREPHHGVEFANPGGTPVLAAGDGVVVVAGDDLVAVFGPRPNFYGQLVVIEHEPTPAGQPVYTLYGHLRSVEVGVGDPVSAGDRVGQVGSTGIAIGAHLHFEVRVGANNYQSTRNPELWLIPLPYDGRPNGVVAGRVVDRDGLPVPEVTVVIRPISTESDQARSRFVQTYHGDPALNPDDRLLENFAITDVARGLYSVSVSTTRFYEQSVTVRAGEVAFVVFVVNRPPITSTPAVTDTPPPDTETPTPEGTPPIAETPAAEQTPPGEPTMTIEPPPAETPTVSPS